MGSPMDYIRDLTSEVTLVKDSPICDFYSGKNVLLTGSSGFLGQLYLEKLLRIGANVYILLRPKKGIEPEERLLKILSSPVFQLLLKKQPRVLKKITIIPGTMNELALGISKENLAILRNNIQAIIHAAADVRFDISIYDLTMVNLRGTRELLSIAKTMKKLEIFVYISTAYSHCYLQNIDEQFYNCPMDPIKMISIAENCATDEEKSYLEILTPKFIRPWPNTYTFSKALSEELVRQFGKHFLITVVRPSIVTATNADPIPGWFNNISGINGFVVAIAMGFLRNWRIKSIKSRIEITAADFVINSTFAASSDTLEKNKLKQHKTIAIEPQVYNVTSGLLNPISKGDVISNTIVYRDSLTPANAIWYPIFLSSYCKYQDSLYNFMLHTVPAFVMDAVSRTFTKNEISIIPIYRKMILFINVLSFFSLNEWTVNTTNMTSAHDRMTPYDKDLFPCDVKNLNWRDYFQIYVRGSSKYMFPDKDFPNREQRARRHILVLQALHYSSIIVFTLIFLYLLITGVPCFAVKCLNAFTRYYENL